MYPLEIYSVLKLQDIGGKIFKYRKKGMKKCGIKVKQKLSFLV